MSKIGDYAFDLHYGTNTAQRKDLKDLLISSGNKDRGVNYMPTHAGLFRKLMYILDLPRDGVFVDLGCGKGKVLLLASQCGFRKIVGVEFSRELCAVARKNIAIFQRIASNQVDAVVIESDAVDYAIGPNDSIFFLFNPFDEVVMSAVLDHIAISFEQNRRKIWLIYNHPTCHAAIVGHKCFVELGKYQVGVTEFRVYETSSEEPNGGC